MTEPIPPRAPTTPEEKYQAALRKVMALREKYPDLHDAVLDVLGKHIGDCVQGFFKTEFDPRDASNIHARFTDLDKVARILSDPAPYLKKEQAAPEALAGGGLRSRLGPLFSMGRRVKALVRDRMAKANEGGS